MSKNLIEALKDFYSELDKAIQQVEQLNSERLTCHAGCADCCVDDITVYEIEATNIRYYHPTLLQQESPHPTGACAFLDEQRRCRIYAHRPYVCRTQGLPLRWVEFDENNQTIEFRDICPLNDPPEASPLEALPRQNFWEIGPFEQKLINLQKQFFNGQLKRVKLRKLFNKSQ